MVAIDNDLYYGEIAEIVADRLFFASLRGAPKTDGAVRYVRLEDRIHYEPFYSDFGPLNLSVLYRFCEDIHSLLDTTKHRRKVFVYTSTDDKCRVNGAYIMGAYLIIYHRLSADSAYVRVRVAEPPMFIGFRDASLGEPSYLLHLHDVLRGVEKALSLKWLDFTNFNADEYEHYERVENGDLNWIIPGKIISFCGPHNESRIEDGYPYHSPETYFDYFRDNNVTTIIRLNMKLYEAEKFKKAGFDHVDLFFIDGSTPSEEIVLKFIDVVDKAKGAVAVHCKAGLGRTGTLIACWMMKEYGLTAAECMAWLRICRPGSVIGPQQDFLVAKQKFCWSRSEAVHKTRKKRSNLSGMTHTLSAFKGLTSKVDDIRLSPNGTKLSIADNERVRSSILSGRRTKRVSGVDTTPVDESAVDELGRTQGDRLLAIKARTQAGKASLNTSIPAAYRNPETSRTSAKPEKNGNYLHHQTATTPIVTNPIVARSSASTYLPRFSSPTTPIKQPSPISSPPTQRSRPGESPQYFQSQGNIVSRVTVEISTKATPVRYLSCTKSTSALRKTPGVRTRTLPYPSQGTRVELAASPGGGYELRSRTSPTTSAFSAAAMTLPPNTDALIGSRRKKRST